jgi:hypothetical protein
MKMLNDRPSVIDYDGTYFAASYENTQQVFPGEQISWINPRWSSAPERTNLNTRDIFVHSETSLPDLRGHYESLGWNTLVLLQDVTHEGPSAAHRAGFAALYPQDQTELARWGDDAILRLHIDVYWYEGMLVSAPHVEPDPVTNPAEHLAMYENHDEIRGSLAVNLFKRFFV